MKLFSKTYYHGSGAKFDQFDFDFMGTGEGAQVHGWGIYLAEKKSTATGYRNKLSEYEGRGIKIGKRLFDVNDDKAMLDYFLQLCPELLEFKNYYNDFTLSYHDYDIEEVVYNMMNRLDASDSSPEKIINEINPYSYGLNDMRMNEYGKKIFTEELKKAILKTKLHFVKGKKGGMLATVQVDDDTVLVSEDALWRPDEINDAIDEVFREDVKVRWSDYPEDFEDGLRAKISENRRNYDMGFIGSMVDMDALLRYTSYVYGDYRNDIDSFSQRMGEWIRENNRTTLVPNKEDIRNLAKLIFDSANELGEFIIPRYRKLTFKKIYELVARKLGAREASLAFRKHGIDGILYDGWRDGKCVVLWNLKKCKIL